jgi:hypothetical protein
MTALGGKVTRMNGMQMLAATNGIVAGLNESSEEKFKAGMDQWERAYQQMSDHQRRLMDIHRAMLTAYEGRSDAYQKAAEAARRMTGDEIDEKQRKVQQGIDTFKALQAAKDRADRLALGYSQLNERVRHDLAQESVIKEKLTEAEKYPWIKTQMAGENMRWKNAKAQIDENMKRRGEVNSSLTIPEDQKELQINAIDEADERLKLVMDEAVSNMDNQLANARATAGGGGVSGSASFTGIPAKPGSLLPPENTGRTGTINRTGQAAGQDFVYSQPAGSADIPPQAVQRLEAAKGRAVQFENGQVWIMDQNGQVRRVQ